MTALLFLMLFQLQSDVSELRQLLGADFNKAMRLLVVRNDEFVRGSASMNRSSNAETRPLLRPPSSPGKQYVYPLTRSNIGRALVSTLFEQNFITKTVNLMLCPGSQRVIAVQVLFDDSHAIADTPGLFRSRYEFPPPLAALPPAFAVRYPLAGFTYSSGSRWAQADNAILPIMWEMGGSEAVYQPVPGLPGITGQLWITDRTQARACKNPPALPAPGRAQ